VVGQTGSAGEDLDEEDEVEGGLVCGVDAVEDDFFFFEERIEGV
jgi:hypothetical protein